VHEYPRRYDDGPCNRGLPIRKSIRAIVRWAEESPRSIVACALSFSAGLAVMLPFGITLPESAAAFVGALLGAAITVAGAFWLTDATGARQKRDVAHGLVAVIGNLMNAVQPLADLAVLAGARKSTERAVQLWEQVTAADIAGEISKFQTRMARFDQAVPQLGLDSVTKIIAIEDAIRAYQRAANERAGATLRDTIIWAMTEEDPTVTAFVKLGQACTHAVDHFERF
jgi:hypothetical protein